MPLWQQAILAVALVLIIAIVGVLIWLRRAGISAADAAQEARAMGLAMVSLPGRLRRLAGDPRLPRRARWMLIGLAIYLVSPIDIIPDFLPGIGQMDDIVIVVLVLVSVRRMVPPGVWDEYFPKGEGLTDRIKDPR